MLTLGFDLWIFDAEVRHAVINVTVNYCNNFCCAGNLEHGVSSGGGTVPGLRHRGAAANFLEKRGFGWLMEVADDDDEDQKPLLYDFVELLIASTVISC